MNISKVRSDFFFFTIPPCVPQSTEFLHEVLPAEGRSCKYRSTCWLVNLLVSLLKQFKIYVSCKVLRNTKCLLLQVTRETGSIISPLCLLLQHFYLRGGYHSALGQVFVTVASVQMNGEEPSQQVLTFSIRSNLLHLSAG